MTSLPRVLLIGRTNVGKSTLFNRLSSSAKSITLDQEGVTRDFITDTVCWQERCFELTDTGGLYTRKTTDPIVKRSVEKSLSLLDEAAIVLFVLDGITGVLPEEQSIARLLHKSGKKVFVVVNKADKQGVQEKLYEFEKLGFGEPIGISAMHGTGITDVLDVLVEVLPKTSPVKKEETGCKVVLLGKPNVGKSSLLNLLLGKERSIVADMPGTTREPVRETVSFYSADFELTDTPGIRKKRKVSEELETLMVKSALRAVENADVVMLLMDASYGRISDQELKLAFYIFEKKKALILLLNKYDLVDEVKQADLDMSFSEYTYFTKHIPMMRISCKTGQNIGKILPTVQKLCHRYNQRLSDDDLVLMLKTSLHKKPLYANKNLLRLYHARQLKTAPITIFLTVKEPKFWGPTQLGFIENRMRKEYDLQGVPIRFIVRKK